jgi:hypothetical protein
MPAACALAAEHRYRFDLYFFSYSHSGHTGHQVDWNEVDVAMIKETRAG